MPIIMAIAKMERKDVITLSSVDIWEIPQTVVKSLYSKNNNKII